ncbi:general substrate transporter [Exophiala viscosa]|uniref:general substrate transporter n=1 Tax=Exophiala viscosa TaxID=2486360 RepID=UPI002197148F|nr:general substrate transporter [Exophiala viscosa]
MVKDSEIVGAALARVLPAYEKPWYRIPHLLQLNLILIVPLLSSAVAGYDGSMMNGLQATSSWKAYFNNPTGSILGVVNAAQSIGSVAILPLVAPLSDRLGRKWTLLIGIVTIIIASIIQAASVNYAMFVVSRIIVGAGGMLVTQPSPMLISELCFPTHRGKYTSLFWTIYYFGAILAAWSTYGTQKHIGNSDWAWRAPSILQAAYPIIQLCFWWFVPESPRWLIANGKIAEARAILARFHTGGDSNHELIEFEMAEISQAIEAEREAKNTKWSSLVATPGNRRRLFIVVCVGAFAQWNGVAVVSYYLTLVLDTVGITDPDTQTLINGLLQIFNFWAAVSAAFLVDRLGRRTLFNWSGIGMLVSFVIWTACSAVFDINGNKSAGIAVVAFVFIYFFHYDICYTPLLFGYTTEILPYSLRAKGLTAELLSIYGSLVLLAFVNPIALENIGWHYYIVFCCLLVVIVLVAFFLFPETKGHSLEEIAEIFDGPRARPMVVDDIMLDNKDTHGEGVGVEHVTKV